MNYITRTLKILLLYIMIFCVSAQADTWKITSLEWPPYSGANLPEQGLAIKALRDHLKTQNINLIVEFYPWKRAMKVASRKEYMGYFPAWPEEVGLGFHPSKAIFHSEISVFKNSDVPEPYINLEETFKRHKVGVVSTYSYPKEITNLIERYPKNTSFAKTEYKLLSMLDVLRHPFAISDVRILEYYLKKGQFQKIVPVKKLFKKKLVIAVKNDKSAFKKLKLINFVLTRKK